MADALVVLDHRHLAAFGHRSDQSLAAPGHAKVHVLGQRQEGWNGLAIGRRHHLDGVLWKTRQHGLGRRDQRLGNQPVGVQCLLATPKDSGVARLETQRGRISGHIGAGFVNDDDHTNGCRDFAEAKSVGTFTRVQYTSDGIRKIRDLAQPLSHGGNAVGTQRQTIHHGSGQSEALADFQVECIGLQQAWPSRNQTVGHRPEAAVLFIGRQPGQFTRCGLGSSTQFRHFIHQRHGTSVALQGGRRKTKIRVPLLLDAAAAAVGKNCGRRWRRH